jgi:hypothetical protein
MSVDLYNVVFTGELIPGTSPEIARRGLRKLFKLDSERLNNLFSGQRIVVKHGANLDTAAQFQDAFRAAGARVTIEPVEASSALDASIVSAAIETTADALSDSASETLALAPLGDSMSDALEQIDEQEPDRYPDTSAFSLITSNDWSFEDCQPPPPIPPALDIGHLRLEPMAAPKRDD